MLKRSLPLPGIHNPKSFANSLPQVPKIWRIEKMQQDVLRTGIRIWEIEKEWQRQRKALKALRTLSLEIEKLKCQELIRNLEVLRALSLEAETMRLQKFERDLEVLQASLNQISQMPQITRILPQGAAKAISEAKPPKKKKAEPMSSDDYENDPYVHVHCIC